MVCRAAPPSASRGRRPGCAAVRRVGCSSDDAQPRVPGRRRAAASPNVSARSCPASDVTRGESVLYRVEMLASLMLIHIQTRDQYYAMNSSCRQSCLWIRVVDL